MGREGAAGVPSLHGSSGAHKSIGGRGLERGGAREVGADNAGVGRQKT